MHTISKFINFRVTFNYDVWKIGSFHGKGNESAESAFYEG